MASSSQPPLPPSQSTSVLLRGNLNRCHSTGSSNNRSKISSVGAGVCLFDSSKLRNIKANILQEISSKWEATFSDQSGTPAHLAAGKTLLNDKPASSITTTSPMSVNRKHKMRSVYGQPEVEPPTACSNAGLQNGKQWSSLDSLDTYDSGNGGMGSTSTSCSDLRVTESQHHHMCNKGNAMINTTAERTSAAAVCSSDLATSVESSDNEQEMQEGYENKHARCSSLNSTSSGCSIDSQSEVDEMSREAKFFMRDFVKKIFSNSSSISLEEKASFGQYARSENGRVWFGRYITKERNENKRVSESTFYSLAQYFAIVLFECADADHFTPAKSLMNMCFTYYHQPASRPWSSGNSRGNGTTNNISNSQNSSISNNKQYLSSVLRDQPIWRSLRFWNAAFFDAVQAERVTFFESSRSADHHHRPPSSVMISSLQQDALDDWQFQANVTFGQLGTFTYQMHSFGLPKGLCLEFLRKQSTIANLTSEQIHLLIENIETMYKNGVA